MPYWDYTYDSGLEYDPPIFHLNIGDGGGGEQNDYCVQDPLWTRDKYTTGNAFTLTCERDEIAPNCCLKRAISQSQLLPSSAQIGAVFIRNTNFLQFEQQIDAYHVWPHIYLAVNTYCTMATAYAPDDPLFFLLHTFTIYQRALFTTCNGYDSDHIINNLDQYEDAYTPSCNQGIFIFILFIYK